MNFLVPQFIVLFDLIRKASVLPQNFSLLWCYDLFSRQWNQF